VIIYRSISKYWPTRPYTSGYQKHFSHLILKGLGQKAYVGSGILYNFTQIAICFDEEWLVPISTSHIWYRYFKGLLS